jgi:hypothetical protein
MRSYFKLRKTSCCIFLQYLIIWGQNMNRKWKIKKVFFQPRHQICPVNQHRYWSLSLYSVAFDEDKSIVPFEIQVKIIGNQKMRTKWKMNFHTAGDLTLNHQMTGLTLLETQHNLLFAVQFRDKLLILMQLFRTWLRWLEQHEMSGKLINHQVSNSRSFLPWLIMI